MTRSELLEEKLVRSKTMRVTVKASEHSKAMNPDLWPFRVGVRLYKAQSWRQGQEANERRRPGQPGGGRGGQDQDRQHQKQPHFPPGSEEYSRKRNRYQSVGGWQVPHSQFNTVNEQGLLEALKSLLSSSP